VSGDAPASSTSGRCAGIIPRRSAQHTKHETAQTAQQDAPPSGAAHHHQLNDTRNANARSGHNHRWRFEKASHGPPGGRGRGAHVTGAAVETSQRRDRRVVTVVLLALVVSLLPAAGGQFEVIATPLTIHEETEVPLPSADDLAAGVLGAAQLSSGAVRGPVVEAPVTFSMLGFELPDGVDDLRVRTSQDGRTWTDWTETERFEPDEGPDPGTDDGRNDRSHRFAEPVWVEKADYFQVEFPDGLDGVTGEMTAEIIDSVGYNGQGSERHVVSSSADAQATPSRPNIISRAQWGADESWAGDPTYASDVDMGVVHHTATSNNYSDARAVIRSMYRYHTQSLGWKDLGYNIVIDRAGNVYEGRKGGLDRGVVGAHASGFNRGSFGVSVIGNYEAANPTQASMRALEDVIAWQSSVYGIHPQGTTDRDGVRRSTIVGHRQVGQTACPGRIMNQLQDIRARAAQRSVPFPDVSGIHREAVLQLAEDGVINGCGGGLYCPARGLTRGQMASLMARALDLRESSSRQRFPDVPADHPHRAGIHALVEAGVVSGYPDGTFRPQQDVQRDQMATFLTNGLKLHKQPYQGRFVDVLPTNPHARAVEAVAREEVTLGCDSNGTRYCPGDTLRRDQAASLLHRALYLHRDESSSLLGGLTGR
jgi:hypothetical protein